MIWPLWTRGLAEVALRLRGGYDRPERHPYDEVDVFNIGCLPIRKRKESRPYSRSPASIDTIVVHVSGVRGGFGTADYQVAPWRKRIAMGTVPTELAEQLDNAWPEWRSEPEDAARFLALAQRYRDTPYHVIGSRKGWVFVNREIDRRTSHAGPHGNDGIGVCLMDCSPDEDMGRRAADAAECALLTAITDVLPRSRYRVIAHAQVEDPSKRGNDPGPWAWGITSVVVDDYGDDYDITLDEDFHAGKGRPIPNDWRAANQAETR